MLNNKWVLSVHALYEYRLEEALRLIKSLLDSCAIEDYSPPQLPFYLANRSILHWTLGETDDALRYAVAAVSEAPNLAILRFVYGCIAFEMGFWQRAWVEFAQCVDLFPSGPGQDKDRIDCEEGEWGLEYVLRKEQVRENMEKAHAKCVFDDGTLVGIWRVPGLRMFEPRGSDGELIGRSFGGAVDFSL